MDDLRSTFGTELVGAYLYGSAVMGGFDPGLSDLDLVVVTEQSTNALGFVTGLKAPSKTSTRLLRKSAAYSRCVVPLPLNAKPL